MNEQEKLEKEIAELKELGVEKYLKQKATVPYWVLLAALGLGFILGALIL